MISSKLNKKLIFVIGSGRSGTHLLGRTFENNLEVDALIEDKEFFYPITQLAVGLNKNNSDFQKILKKYDRRFHKSKKEVILEKTHPNIWFVEEILEFFPSAKFIGIKRNVFATVSSMLKHKGVLKWYKELPQDCLNQFLGIDETNINEFESLPLESKCALRWQSHKIRLEYLADKYPDNVCVIDYEDFYDSYSDLMNDLRIFLNLDFALNSEPLNQSGKDKWKDNLSEEQVYNIKTAIGE